MFFYASSDIYPGLTWRNPFSNQKTKLNTQIITRHLKFAEYCVQELKKSVVEKGEGSKEMSRVT